MKYRKLGKTDLELSEVGFGVWSVSTGWWGKVEERDAVAILNKAFDLGVNFFDTADTYGQGYGEEILPKALASPSQRRGDWDEVRLRLLLQRGAVGPQRAAAGLLAGVRAVRLRAEPATPEDRLHRPVPAPQPAAERHRKRRPL